jgi:hypothetical protein
VCSFQVAELEEQVREVTAQRRQAERAATEVLATLESQGFGAHLLSDADDDSGSDRDGEVDDEDTKCRGDTVRAPGEEESAAQGDADDAMSGTAQPGGLSWKGRSVSPRRARQLMQKHRRSYFCLLSSSSDSSPKYRMGQSCRKNKRQMATRCHTLSPPEPKHSCPSAFVRFLLPDIDFCRSAAMATGRYHRERMTAVTPWPRRVRRGGKTGRIVRLTARMTWTAKRVAMSGVQGAAAVAST